MPVDSKYTDKILTFMQREARPLTASELQEAVGMSRQAAYQWLESNAWRVREVGTGRHNARAYVLVEDGTDEAGKLPTNFKPARVWQTKPRSQRHAPPITSLLQGEAADLQVGSTLTVVSIRLVGGAVVVDLTSEDGATLSVAVS